MGVSLSLMNKKGFFTGIIVLGVLLVVGFFWFVGEMNGEDEEFEEGCIKIQTTCCPCNMGGEEKCVLESEVAEYEDKLSECSESLICAASYNCKIDSCEYVAGECVAA